MRTAGSGHGLETLVELSIVDSLAERHPLRRARLGKERSQHALQPFLGMCRTRCSQVNRALINAILISFMYSCKLKGDQSKRLNTCVRLLGIRVMSFDRGALSVLVQSARTNCMSMS